MSKPLVKYLQTSEHHYVRLDTMKFCQSPLGIVGYDIDVPFYLWHDNFPDVLSKTTVVSKDGKDYPICSYKRKVTEFVLNRCIIQFASNINTAKFIFENLLNGNQVEELELNAVAVCDAHGWYGGARYSIITRGNSVGFVSNIKSGNFKPVSGLESTRFVYSYGMTPTQLKIVYGDKEVGRSYAWIFGHWAILFDDDLKFDSLAALIGTDSDTLYIDKFFYTTNMYVMKLMLLSKRS